MKQIPIFGCFNSRQIRASRSSFWWSAAVVTSTEPHYSTTSSQSVQWSRPTHAFLYLRRVLSAVLINENCNCNYTQPKRYHCPEFPVSDCNKLICNIQHLQHKDNVLVLVVLCMPLCGAVAVKTFKQTLMIPYTNKVLVTLRHSSRNESKRWYSVHVCKLYTEFYTLWHHLWIWTVLPR